MTHACLLTCDLVSHGSPESLEEKVGTVRSWDCQGRRSACSGGVSRLTSPLCWSVQAQKSLDGPLLDLSYSRQEYHLWPGTPWLFSDIGQNQGLDSRERDGAVMRLSRDPKYYGIQLFWAAFADVSLLYHCARLVNLMGSYQSSLVTLVRAQHGFLLGQRTTPPTRGVNLGNAGCGSSVGWRLNRMTLYRRWDE